MLELRPPACSWCSKSHSLGRLCRPPARPFVPVRAATPSVLSSHDVPRAAQVDLVPESSISNGAYSAQEDQQFRASSGSVQTHRTRTKTGPQQVQQQQQQQQQPADLAVAVVSEGKQSRQQPDYELVDTGAALSTMLEQLRHVKCIGLDCEGLKLGDKEEGKLSLMQISALVGKGGAGKGPLRIWLVDVAVLAWRSIHYRTADRAFNLKALLEDSSVTKLMFDVRSDSAQLSKEYGVRLRGVYDLQLAEVAHRQLQLIPTAYLLPLTKTLEKYVRRLPTLEKDMLNSQDVARAYHYSNKTEIWEQRPLAEELQEYAACDVRYLHALAGALNKKLPKEIVSMVQKASQQRILVPGTERAAAPTIVKKSDVRRLLRPRGQQPTQQQGPASVRPPLLVLADIRTVLGKQQGPGGCSSPDAVLDKSGEQQGQPCQEHPLGGGQEVLASICAVVDSLEHALQRCGQRHLPGQEPPQPRHEQGGGQQVKGSTRQPQGGLAVSKPLPKQAARDIAGCLEQSLAALACLVEAQQQQQQQQLLQGVLARLQAVLGSLHSVVQEPVESTDGSSTAAEMKARAPPPLLRPGLEGEDGQPGASTAASTFLLKPRKRQPGEPEPSWLQEMSIEEGAASAAAAEQGSSGAVGECMQGSAEATSSEVSHEDALEAGVQGSGQVHASINSTAGNEQVPPHPTAAPSPFLLWAPATLEKKQQEEASKAVQTSVKRPLRKPS